MVLGCRLEHLRNQNVLVNGNTYRVGDNGIVTDIADADAWKLLASPGAWFRIGPSRGDTGPLDPTRELDTPAERIPRDADGNLRVLDLGPDMIDLRTTAPVAEIKGATAAFPAAHSAPSLGQAATAGAGATPGIPPAEAPEQAGLGQSQSFAHAPDGHIEPVKKRRGRPPRKVS